MLITHFLMSGDWAYGRFCQLVDYGRWTQQEGRLGYCIHP